MTHVPALTALILRRLAREGLAPDSPIAVAELHRRLVPYAVCREALGLTTKAEYDLVLLQLLDDVGVEVEEKALRDAVRRELESPEPGLAILQRFAASEVRIGAPDSVVTGQTGAPDSAVASGPPPADFETERMAQDRIPGLDDLEFRPEAASPPGTEADPARPVFAISEGGVDHGMQGTSGPEAARCRACTAELPSRDGLKFCPTCGANQDRWPCATCGETVERGWKFCAMCGAGQ